MALAHANRLNIVVVVHNHSVVFVILKMLRELMKN